MSTTQQDIADAQNITEEFIRFIQDVDLGKVLQSTPLRLKKEILAPIAAFLGDQKSRPDVGKEDVENIDSALRLANYMVSNDTHFSRNNRDSFIRWTDYLRDTEDSSKKDSWVNEQLKDNPPASFAFSVTFPGWPGNKGVLPSFNVVRTN